MRASKKNEQNGIIMDYFIRTLQIGILFNKISK
jgi:hypothetical protein